MLQPDLFTDIFGTISNEDKSEFIKNSIIEYPYFSVAHFLLLKEINDRDTDYDHIAGRTAIHFNNPFYLNYLLNKKDINFPVDSVIIPDPAKNDNIESFDTSSGHEIHDQIEEKKTIGEAAIFEPLFASDYFASQGIKLGEEIKPDDKLGKQLKSFTDWLKTMKNVHDQKLTPGNEQLDMAVQNIAEKSNKEEVILTESMAEVYYSQGKLEKAKEIYRKLSLLNPAKSAYFAAKSELFKDK